MDVHLRLAKVSEEALVALKTMKEVKAIVLHKRGKKGEHPHWHVWLHIELLISHEAVRKRLRKHAIFETYKGNEHWSIRVHDSYDKWAKYVMSNTSAEVLLDNPESPLPPKVEIPIVASAAAQSGGAIVVLKKPTDRTPQRVRFVKHLELKGWTTDCIKHWNLYEKLDELIEELTDWSENAFTTPNGSATVQHALWTFADVTARNTIKEKNKESLRKSIRLFS